ncbi:type I-F CRISPR-associated endoribonuclease Cas6/Csy4 [Modicisalibacter tunisiensis]|uniref:Type I-F CRISPR-associated endoribonuclease Cas6/Csy4 n=1 Tax=Modicisalibacter tunisiensis TaxID=390637 RepID=A0ABS7WWN8_9GAMM|nr:type I-F CRISPR-associated endoribonuclease Cas6/Csy4 [Modicisalibacter tunisiensis]MBZ9539577.1 type I-F CRISPR-associated endoribonuclease Cas6/Csy4 [Modicisalibacter tunisiensis]MBZ9567018.1 type I-F CRISPR-associated endoribonuclease Cas6/Csy4 [Modicisalibacter tunisiensis]
MQPRWFCDIEVRPQPLPRPMAASAIVRVLHGAFRQAPGRHALAMPSHARLAHSVLRVFASGRDELDALIANIREAPSLLEQAVIHYPRSVPEDYAGSWSIYQRFRIPSRRAERIPGRSVRLKRVQEANARELPFFQMKSDSNGGRFRLYWSVQPYTGSEPKVRESTPDSWGLSTTTNPVPLPDIT